MSVTITTISTAAASAPTYNTYLIAVKGGKIYAGTPGTGPVLAGGQTAAPLLATVPVADAVIYTVVYFVDGANITTLNLANLTVVPYADTAGVHPGPGTFAATIAGVGTVATATVASTAGLIANQTQVIIAGASPSLFNGTFLVTSVTSATTFTYTIPSHTGAATGTINVNPNYTTCCLACAWRGRLVLAGDSANPQNFYMSRAGTATDWNYAATDPAAAVAGNLSTSGLIGEAITALIPFSDDVMLIGCTRSLWMLQGDPADGGTIVPVSAGVGVLGPYAWTKDTFDSLYFLGQGGMYSVRPLWEQWQPPKLLTGETYQQYFQGLVGSGIYPTMVWDEDNHYMYLFATTSVEGSVGSIHLIYDLRSEGLWPQQFSTANQGPTVALNYFADASPTNRGILLGGWDGKLRKLDPLALDDDGSAIKSTITLGPFKPMPEASILTGLTIDLGEVPSTFTGAGNNPLPQVGQAVGTGDGTTHTFTLNTGGSDVIIDTVQLFVNGVQMGQPTDFTVTIAGSVTFVYAPVAGAVITANYFYLNIPPDPWNVLATVSSGPDAYAVTEGIAHTATSIPMVLERRQKTFRQRLRGGWFSLTLSNAQDSTFFSFESALLEFKDGGRNRERR